MSFTSASLLWFAPDITANPCLNPPVKGIEFLVSNLIMIYIIITIKPHYDLDIFVPKAFLISILSLSDSEPSFDRNETQYPEISSSKHRLSNANHTHCISFVASSIEYLPTYD